MSVLTYHHADHYLRDVQHYRDPFYCRFECSVSFVGSIEGTEQVRQGARDVRARDVECDIARGLEEPQDVFAGVQVFELRTAVPVEQVDQDGRSVQVHRDPGCVNKLVL